MSPIVLEKGMSSDIFSANLEDRTIHLIGPITDEMAATIVAQLLYLAKKKPKGEGSDIQLYINSPGGSVSAGFAIYDTMRFITPDIMTVCVGRAASMAAVILSGDKKGKRCILPHAEVMIHQPSGGMEGQSEDMVIAAEHIKETRNVLNGILAENTGKQLEDIIKDTDRDHWMRADEAVSYGIVDRVLR
ncbi:MAG: ATP-dependent Clp protease proteolytic subunit [Lachnospiraceae bacterium]|nr:ATP-dependent Clp protease proteolytic subunit [Lachnospiraceae bacterium]